MAKAKAKTRKPPADPESLLMQALRTRPEGLTRTEIQTEVFSNNLRIERLDPLIDRLVAAGAIESAQAERLVKRTVQIFRLRKPK